MKKENQDEVIDKIFILKAGEKVFSIALQETIMFERDIYVGVTNTTTFPDYVFGNIQVRFGNETLSAFAKTNCETFIRTKHGDIGVNLSQLTPYES